MGYENYEVVLVYEFEDCPLVELSIDGNEVVFPAGSLQASVHLKLIEEGFSPVYIWSEEFDEPLLVGIPDEGDFLVLVDGKEPENGEIALRKVFPLEGEVKVLRC